MPSWWGDARRVMAFAVISTVFWTVVLLLAKLGLVSNNGRDVEGDVVLAGILAAMAGLMLPFLQLAAKRPDQGFRSEGLVPLMWFVLVAGALVHTAGILLWPFVLGDLALAGTTVGELHSGALAVLTVFAFVLASMAWFSAIVMVMILWAPVGAIVGLVPFLGSVFLFGLMGVKVFESAPTLAGLGIWGGAAFAGLGAVTLVSALRVRSARRAQAEQAALPHRPSLEELGWKGPR